jgi:dephospho-CoA kinase
VGQDGEINREALGTLIFSDPAQRRRLNRATHLPIFVTLGWEILKHWILLRRVLVVDMPLLFETKFERWCATTVCVACSQETQRERLMRRDGSTHEEAQRRMDAQMPLEDKMRLAHVVLDNSGPREELEAAVARWVAREMRQAPWGRTVLLSPLGFALIPILCAVTDISSWMTRISGALGWGVLS